MQHLRALFLCGLVTTAALAQEIRISEFLANAPGGDEGREYFEISGPAGASLDGITLIEIEGDGGGSGFIDAAFDLTGLSLGSNGLLLLRDQSEITIGDTTVPAVIRPFPDPATNVFVDGNNVGDYNNDSVVNAADYAVWRTELAAFQDDASGNADNNLGELVNDLTPGSVAAEDFDVWLQNFGLGQRGQFFNEDLGGIENGSITFALVQGFTGAADIDLDTDNDGQLDVTPWSSVLDAVGFDEDGPLGAGNRAYAAQLGGFEFDGTIFNSLAGFFDDPDGFVLIDDGTGESIPAAFYVDSSSDDPESAFDEPELFFDPGNGTLQVLDTRDLGPYSVLLGEDGVTPVLVTVDETGEHRLVDPDPVAVTGETLGIPALTVLDALGNPAELFLLTPGGENGTGTVGDVILPPPPAPAASSVPEPSASALVLVALTGAAGLRRRSVEVTLY